MSKVTRIKRAINLFLGITSTISFALIALFSGIAALFADCPSCDASIPFVISILALVGAVCSKVLTIFGSLKDSPYRIDTLFFLPALFVFLEIIRPTPHNIQIALYSVGVALLIEIGFIIWICIKLLSNKFKKNHLKTAGVSSAKKFLVSQSITPLLGAILANDTTLVRTALQEHPEYINTAYAQNGNTPLHVAALNGQTEIVKLLLEQPGLDTTLKNNEGKTAADLAQEKNFTEIADLLK